MADITFLNHTDATVRTHTGDTTDTEMTDFTVSWSDMTTAGFANGDDVIVIMRINFSGDSGTNRFGCRYKVGSTFGGASALAEMICELNRNSVTANGSKEFMYVDRLTLTTNDNIYTSLQNQNSGSNTISGKDFSCLILKLDDLAADDFRYAEDTSSGDAPTTDTDGASVTLPASGGDDWLIVASIDWLVDSITIDSYHHLSLDSVVQQSLVFRGVDTADKLITGLVGYEDAAANSSVCKVVYSNNTSGTNDYTRSAIFALRLQAFTDSIGVYDEVVTSASSTANLFVETQTASLSLTTTGEICYFSQTGVEMNTALNSAPRHRVQADGTDIITGFTTYGHNAEEPEDVYGLSSFGTKSLTSGTIVIDTDCTNSLPNLLPDFQSHTLVAFSMDLAGAGGTVTPQIMNNRQQQVNQ